MKKIILIPTSGKLLLTYDPHHKEELITEEEIQQNIKEIVDSLKSRQALSERDVGRLSVLWEDQRDYLEELILN